MSETLLDKIGTSNVIKTDSTRKITLDGETKVLPVYKIKLSELYYNDQNDRIATSIDAYNKTHTVKLLPGKNEGYNKVIENFIVKSNEQAIFKTKNNIRLVHQREAGVVLPDGRVIDGNRRFTCLRQLSDEAECFTYFEAIILPDNADEKQIKLLELMIQHGEEQRVEYDPIDMIVGMYHDIIETRMITVGEYAKAIDVSEREIELKLKMAETFVDFLEFLNMPKHWYLVKEFSIYSATSGLGTRTSLDSVLRKCDDKYKEDLKKIIYVNIILETSGKLIEIVSKLIVSDLITSYIRHTRQLADDLKKQLDEIPYSNYDELKNIIRMNSDIKRELTQLLDETFLKHKKSEVHSQPSKNVSKAITMIKSIDSGVIDRLSEKESVEFKQNIIRLNEYVNQYKDIIQEEHYQDTSKLQSDKATNNVDESSKISSDIQVKSPFSIDMERVLPPVYVNNTTITSLLKEVEINSHSDFIAYFSGKDGKRLSEDCKCDKGNQKITFDLNATVSALTKCYLIIRNKESSEREVSQIIPFDVSMNFVAKFDF